LRLAVLLSAAALACLPAVGRAWGTNGHAMVADIAQAQLSEPAIQAEIARLLPFAKEIDSGTLPATNLADIASAPDAWRAGGHPETGPWHYVDIPLRAPSYDEARDCHQSPDGKEPPPAEDNCVVAKLPEFVAILADKSRSDRERGHALAFVVHFVGDIHQPLHAEDDHDKGGNDVKFTWRNGANPTNLHTVWDSTLIDEHFALPVAHKDPDPNKNYKIDLAPAKAAIARLDPAACPDKPADWVKDAGVRDIAAATRAWAEQSHHLAQSAYDALPPDHPAGWEDRYAAFAEPIVECQLQRAGYRLAKVLREALAG